MTETTEILTALPYSEPFLFVDQLSSVSENGAAGGYTFKKDAYFYAGHFKDRPVTPGVILIECMAQIGLVCYGIYLSKNQQATDLNSAFVMSSSEIDFFLPVLPGESVRVISEKIYYRFQKLKCKVKMINSNDKIVCKGTISGMLLNN